MITEEQGANQRIGVDETQKRQRRKIARLKEEEYCGSISIRTRTKGEHSTCIICFTYSGDAPKLSLKKSCNQRRGMHAH